MERKRFDNLKNLIVNFKLDYCCWCVPIRIGLLITGYINVIGSCIYLVGTAEGSLSTPVSLVQDQILDDKANSVIPIVVYATELAFGVVLLCGLYRRDIQLLRVFMRFCIGDVIISSLVYSMVVASIGVLTSALLVTLIVLQVYLIILVRSMIVEFRLAKKNLELPTIVMSTLKRQKDKETFPETVVIHELESNDKNEETKAIKVEIIDKNEDTKDKIKEAKDKKKEMKDKKEVAKDKKKEMKDKKEETKDKEKEMKDKKEKEGTKDKKEDTKDIKEDTTDKKKEVSLETVQESHKDINVSKEKN